MNINFWTTQKDCNNQGLERSFNHQPSTKITITLK